MKGIFDVWSTRDNPGNSTNNDCSKVPNTGYPKDVWIMQRKRTPGTGEPEMTGADAVFERSPQDSWDFL